MRFIVALALLPFLSAQGSRDENIARSEAALKQHPENLGQRSSLLRLYYGNPDDAIDAPSRDARRRHILWLIENRPDAPDLSTYFGMLEASGTKADPEGQAQAADLWQRQIAKPDASAKVLANAAWFYKMFDRAQSFALVSRALQSDPQSHEAARMRGILDVLSWFGAVEFQRGDSIGKFDPALRDQRAFDEIEASSNAALVAGAAEFVVNQYGRSEDAIGTGVASETAMRWAARAKDLDPNSAAYRAVLLRAYQRKAGETLDPRWKVHLLAETPGLAANESQRARVLADLAVAELEAADEEGANRDARAALAIGKEDYAIHTAHTVLGEIAADHGRMDEAKDELLASARIKSQITPRMNLAQDLVDRGNGAAAVEYLELCRTFWKNDRGFVDHFVPLLKSGKRVELTTNYNPNPPAKPKPLPAPELVADTDALRWKPVAGAESYVVEWDVQRNGRWESDTDGSVRVVPTLETSAKLDRVRNPVRWRVYAVNRTGAGVPSAWQVMKNLQ